MEANILELPYHMREFGLHLMGRAVRDSCFIELGSPYAHAMAVPIAAHAAEIIIKSKIAEEHPLLIFPKLPKPSSGAGQLTIEQLLSEGRSLQFADLADSLWASTGYLIKDLQKFREFGDLRNTIIHCAVPDINLSEATLRFAFEVMQPMISQFWGTSLLDYVDQYDDDMDVYLPQALEVLGLVCPPRVEA